MCRLLAYAGPPIELCSLITQPRNSLIHQSFNAEEYEERLNGDGFGVAWYNPEVSETPGVFKSVTPAWSNRNLLSLCRVVRSTAVLAHVRAASPGMPVTEVNCHPFTHGPLAFAHNGDVGGFTAIRRALRRGLSDKVYDGLEGTTDSEHLFALFLDLHGQLDPALPRGEALAAALIGTIQQVLELQRAHGVNEPSWLNIAVTDGQRSAVSRFTTAPPEDAMSLYVHTGRRYVCDGEVCQMVEPEAGHAAVVVSSERLSDDPGWRPVPVNHLVLVRADHTVELRPIPLA